MNQENSFLHRAFTVFDNEAVAPDGRKGAYILAAVFENRHQALSVLAAYQNTARYEVKPADAATLSNAVLEIDFKCKQGETK